MSPSASTAPPRLFGTDGIRGRFGEPPLDRATVSALARALAAELCGRAAARNGSGPGPTVVLGGDTRDSTPEICAWLAAGLAAGGVAVRYAGVIPTPGVAFLAAHLRATAGIAVSASHNPHPDNGIKLLDGNGLKWSEASELSLEARLAGEPGVSAAPAAPPLTADPGLRESYIRHLVQSVEGAAPRAAAGTEATAAEPAAAELPLAGLRVVLDAGNGAAWLYAGEAFARLGAEVAALLGAAPDGRNVNLGIGSTAPEKMAATVVRTGADLGAAFDGDADRCILADENGLVCDGDAILYLWATGLLAEGRLAPPRIVATSMSNLGLERALARRGIAVERCDVGDRWVVEAMRREGLLLGGEQSGHIVCFGLSTTGDGLLTALHTAARVRSAGRPLSVLLAGFRRYPQVLTSVRVARKPDLATLPRVAAEVAAVERELGDDGRLVLRYSGTEPLVRVMIEGPDQPTVEALAARLAGVLAGELGATPPPIQ